MKNRDNEIIDFHMHPFYTADDSLCFYKEVMPLTYENVLIDMKEAGISKFCGSIIKPYSGDFSHIRESNEEALKLREIYGGAYIPGFHISPKFIEESITEIDKAHKNGVNLIGELVPYFHGWEDYSNPEFSILLDHIEKYDMVVSLHSMGLDKMEIMAKKHPHIKFVFAHPGEKNVVLQHIDIMKKCDNVYLDISGTGILRYGVLKKLVSEVGAGHILFGTDYPIGNAQVYVYGVLGEKITDSEKEKILSKNARQLLGC